MSPPYFSTLEGSAFATQTPVVTSVVGGDTPLGPCPQLHLCGLPTESPFLPSMQILTLS